MTTGTAAADIAIGVVVVVAFVAGLVAPDVVRFLYRGRVK